MYTCVTPSHSALRCWLLGVCQRGAEDALGVAILEKVRRRVQLLSDSLEIVPPWVGLPELFLSHVESLGPVWAAVEPLHDLLKPIEVELSARRVPAKGPIHDDAYPG